MKTVLLIVLQLASSGADAYYTHRNFGPGVHEYDPIARPFVINTPDLIVSSAAFAGLKIYAPYYLQRHGHRKLANTAAFTGIALNSLGAAFSATHHVNPQ